MDKRAGGFTVGRRGFRRRQYSLNKSAVGAVARISVRALGPVRSDAPTYSVACRSSLSAPIGFRIPDTADCLLRARTRRCVRSRNRYGSAHEKFAASVASPLPLYLAICG